MKPRHPAWWLQAAILLGSLLGDAAAADYWPLAPGQTWHFEDATGYTLDIQNLEDVETRSILQTWQMPLSGYYLILEGDGAGGVALRSVVCDFAMPGPIMHFDPPLPFLSGPLAPGRSWNWNGTIDGWPVVEPISFQTEGPVTVTVPAGTFEVLILRAEPPLCFGGPLYLDRHVGPVKIGEGPGSWELIAVSGITPADAVSWGAVKGLYR